MKQLKPKDKEVAEKFIEKGSCTAAVKEVYKDLTPGSAKNKASRLLSNDDFWREINDLSLKLGFGVNEAMKLLIEKAVKGDKDSLKALQTWFEVTGNKSPTKLETKNESKVTLEAEEAEEIAKIARSSVSQALNN